jgi:predicted amidohydrolase
MVRHGQSTNNVLQVMQRCHVLCSAGIVTAQIMPSLVEPWQCASTEHHTTPPVQLEVEERMSRGDVSAEEVHDRRMKIIRRHTERFVTQAHEFWLEMSVERGVILDSRDSGGH